MKETLNLLPTEIKAAAPEKKGKFYYLLPGLGAYIGIMLILWIWNLVELRKLDTGISSLNKQKTAMQQGILPPPPAPAAPSLDREISDAMAKAPKWSSIISEMSVIVPEDVWLSSIESKGEKGISLKGFSKTQLGVADFISALEESRHFYDVEIVFAQKGEKEISFELKTKLRWT
ncbi:MAG: hypothetical protein EPN94_08805 [Nitrospirae bacterium]|nr:MAG: hypothetical protein EPN94_08805 [Nitrospirota bacterium]